MEVRNCRNCGRLFNYLGGPNICPACREEVEKKFQEVKEYIRENPRSNIPEIAEANNVTTSQIKQWIREERLQFADDSPVGIECEICGATIKTGKYCESCKNNTAAALAKSIEKPKMPEAPREKPKRENRMRFLEK
ncbi:flagellar operon protein TIGR03826 [Pseudobutyrivibrio sp. NOR37]|uniref:Flagellar protein n=1 Tax=Pseudobutyrivibrio xylanivorans TaxID=185007 RepID=A0A6M0LI16_PSEXY|nr:MULTISPECIES: flagellar protein [Pseudobutyrivibrio]NEX02208.1 flagellar protein [Pseudobutyrivibrio xylanivorans]SFR76959.1 flagellar operon protein TIGR03826 [Pseudobutyrivibrio sp. NOR37]